MGGGIRKSEGEREKPMNNYCEFQIVGMIPPDTGIAGQELGGKMFPVRCGLVREENPP
jgi:hypothetical protein